jgi:hypothetical protein
MEAALETIILFSKDELRDRDYGSLAANKKSSRRCHPISRKVLEMS